MTDRVLRVKDVAAKLGVSKAQIYILIRAGGFPLGVLLGASMRGWRESDIDAWIDSRPKAPRYGNAIHRTDKATKVAKNPSAAQVARKAAKVAA